jgi:hypothetical protein
MANAVCERFIQFIGSLKRECLDHMLVLQQQQLRHAVKEYIDCYNSSRLHQGIGQRIPAYFDNDSRPRSGKLLSTPVPGGLHHSYARAAYLNCVP